MQYVIYFGFVDDVLCFLIIERMGQNQRRRICFVQFTRWRHWAKSAFYDCILCFVMQNADLKQMYAQSDWFNQIKV